MAVVIFAVYAAIAVGLMPTLVRRRYDRLRATHPHTHPRDVRYDLSHAVAGAAVVAVLWPAVGVWRLSWRLAVYLGVTLVGRRKVARHLTLARICLLEQQVAALEEPDDLFGLLRDTRELRDALDTFAGRHPAVSTDEARRRVEAREQRLRRGVAS